MVRREDRQALAYNKKLAEHGGIVRLADFNESRIDKALGTVSDGGASPRTVNAYREVAHALAEWALKIERILDRNPVSATERRNESVDIRKTRFALTIKQARRLLSVCGPRRLFYQTALLTGLRVSEIGAIQWGDLELDGERPCVRLRAADTKSKRSEELPLHPDLVEALCEARPPFVQPADKVFSSTPTLRTLKGYSHVKKDEVRRVRGDLDRAGIAFEDDQGRTFDRHASRTTFISWLGLYGVDPRAQVALARHAPKGITLQHYQDFTVFDLWAEIRKIPSLKPEVKPEAAQATGTHDITSEELAPVLAPQANRKGVKRPQTGRIGAASAAACHSTNTLSNKGKTAPTASKTNWSRAGSNRRPPGCKPEGTHPQNEDDDQETGVRDQVSTGISTGNLKGVPDYGSLAAVVVAWPTLSEGVRDQIAALIQPNQD